MKKQTISLNNSSAFAAIAAWLHNSNVLFSAIMDSKVSNLQAIAISNVCISFMVMICCTSPLALVACFGWFVGALHLCKKGGLK